MSLGAKPSKLRYANLLARLCFVIAFNLGFFPSVWATEHKTVVLATLNWAPYIGEQLPEQGYIAQIVREAFRRAGYQVRFRFFPWARTIKLANAGHVDGYFPEYYSNRIASSFHFSNPMPGGPLGFFKRKAMPLQYNHISDLYQHRVGIVRDYVNTPEIDNDGKLFKVESMDDLANIMRLQNHQVDLAVMDKFVGYYLIGKHLPKQRDELEFVEPPLALKSLYLCLLRQHPHAEQLLEAFNTQLLKMHQDGSLERILNKHGFGPLLQPPPQ